MKGEEGKMIEFVNERRESEKKLDETTKEVKTMKESLLI